MPEVTAGIHNKTNNIPTIEAQFKEALTIKKEELIAPYFRSTVKQRNYVIFLSYEGLFVRINYARLRIYSAIAFNTSAHLGVSSALGALGSRVESCRPDHLKTNSY